MGKTVLARALAGALGAELSRVQGHPDLLPSDITGVTVYSPDTATWEFRPGPVFANVVLLDEMNRTPPRTQSALLESMEEQQVSVDGESWPLPRPHLVIGTQNPDRPGRHLPAGREPARPLRAVHLHRLPRRRGRDPPRPPQRRPLRPRLAGPGGRHPRWARAIAATAEVLVVHEVAAYAVALVRATRTTGSVRLGRQPPGRHLAPPVRPRPTPSCRAAPTSPRATSRPWPSPACPTGCIAEGGDGRGRGCSSAASSPTPPHPPRERDAPPTSAEAVAGHRGRHGRDRRRHRRRGACPGRCSGRWPPRWASSSAPAP